ncbi:MAG: lipoprotein [Bacteroidota bacterium]
MKRMLLLAGLVLLAGCGNKTDLVRIDLGKSSPERLLKFYFGGYAAPDAADPMATGLIVAQTDGYFLNPALLDEGYRGQLDDAAADGVLNWDELEPFLQQTYYSARSAPATLEALISPDLFRSGEGAWMMLPVDGVMTTARRQIYIEREKVAAALAQYAAQNRRIIYPEGTVIVGDHVADERVVETTVMKKRADGMWDYFVYDAAGMLMTATATEPRPLAVPTRCVGCHFGDKQFEPARSYPEPASPGPHGPRGIDLPTTPYDAVLVETLDEHTKRSDSVLGLYATRYLGELLLKGEARTAAEQALLDEIGTF